MSGTLKRVTSFGRKPKSRGSTGSAETSERLSVRSEVAEEGSEARPVSGSKLGRLVRTASFGRSTKKKNGQESTAEAADSSSQPSAGSSAYSMPPPPVAALPPPEARAAPIAAPSSRGLGSLHGWLMKKHTRDKTVTHQWAKRYFTVDDVRGTISYSKGVTKKPTVCLPLVDITTVEEVEEHHSSYSGFLVSCPPVHLTLCAEDKEDRQLWVVGLRKRAKLWQDKVAANGVAVASRADGQSAAAVSGPVADALVVSSPLAQQAQPAEAGGWTSSERVGSGSADVEADAAEERSPEEQEVKKKKKKKKKKPVDEGAPLDGAAEAAEAGEAGAAEAEERPAQAAASPSPSRALPTSPGSRTAAVAPAGAGALRRSNSSLYSPMLRGNSRRVVMAPDEEEAPLTRNSSTVSLDSIMNSSAERSELPEPPPRPAANPSAIQTIEVMSDSDSDSDDADRGGLRRAAAPRDESLKPKGNLEDMLSSDEEEDDGDAIPQHVPMPARALPELEPPPSVFDAPRTAEPEEEEAAPRPHASLPRNDGGGGRPWGGSQAAPCGADAAVGEAWDSDEEASPGRRQPALPPRRSPAAAAPNAGAGIPADRNFVDDDWDEDEDE